MSKIADRYRLLSGGFLARIQAAPADRWDAASPCEGWTARDADPQTAFLHFAGRRPCPR
jgi:hypothetical protein